MIFNKVKIRKTLYVELDLDETDWGLYNLPRADEVAKTLNEKLSKALSEQNYTKAFDELYEYHDFGTTEPKTRMVLQMIIDWMESV